MTATEIVIPREAYDDEKFEKAFQAVLQMDKKDYPSYIGGLMVASGVEYRINSPIDDSIMFGRFQEPEVGTTEKAVDSSLAVFGEWSKTAVSERIQTMEKVLESLCLQRYRFAAIVLISTGMTRQEALKEVDDLIEIISSQIGAVEAVSGKPMGAWAIITAHNSPLASPIGYAVAAILAGNTVVLMPSKYCPLPVYCAYDLFVRAGLPDGVMDIIVDCKDETPMELANDSRLAGVVVSGSGNNLEDMMFLQVDDELAFINELKGMNPVLVYRPADMKKAVRDLLDSAFRYNGQHLFSVSKAIVTVDEQKKFIDELLDQVKDLKITDPAEKDAFSGPMISVENKRLFDKILGGVADCVVCGGKAIVSEFTNAGVYVTPAVITGVDDESDVAFMDFGLPLLYVKVVADIEEAFEEMAYTECGMSAGVFTKDQSLMNRFKEESNLPILFFNKSSNTLAPGLFAKVENFVR